MQNTDIAFSPCPNDTFIFHAMIKGLVDTAPFCFTPHLMDVETLNSKAFSGEFAVTKLSFFAFLLLQHKYEMLAAGAAMGHGCGPLVVAKDPLANLSGARVAVPGKYTTAHLLFRLWCGEAANVEITPYEKILPGVCDGRWNAGVIIHEGRFVYPRYGCAQIIDLGRWWEEKTRLPIPLGCIAVRKDPEILARKAHLEAMIRSSISHARKHPESCRNFIRQHAQEIDDRVTEQHIRLYVNDYTLSPGKAGWQAIEKLEQIARCQNIIESA
ncbi:1,4-dihydroxy-6-naphthoate synthase [Desulfosalsimonas propionicica]|uniref:1,4-dihydroxy-6-naphtoate synthase n=1 Tax=Desulfosalsimonas propionicica TaxID=332175 RepID=A0A7W0HLE8_9BACT|nr:1,4-dihydroxy-6-naphthoate synthase [Desulfosalsimonas propionicica]MBA2882259.1 1,4-dihydroxy-6-naphthoate synthase [Desulfosalsimonas propionicica]